MLTLLLPFLLLAPSATPAPSIGEGWLEDFDRAQQLALETNRDLLVDFTGSDWCSFCKMLNREVLSTSVFQEKASADYVLVKVDLPQTAAGLKSVPNMKRNRELSRQYKIQKFPTILQMTAEGHVYSTKGYEASGALAYWNSLAEQRLKTRGPVVESVELAKAFSTGDADARAKVAARSLILLPQLPPASSAVPLLIEPVAHYLTLDPKNEQGNLARALRVILPSGYALARHLEVARELDPQNKLGLRELALLADAYAIKNDSDTRRVTKAIHVLDAMGPIMDGQAALVLYGNGALWTDRVLRDGEKAKELARKALPYARGKPLENQLQRLLRK